ncbi:A/G-specific adenine glycosylase [Demequina sp. SO4-13]|uniref:A/G-specific adenine glycosylase n=1 Tax=Demequina sp. SO4-13 TaxID=3401027 RepID=UPI003AF50213
MPSPSDTAMVEAVATWFAREARELPWRADNRSPWGVLVSEVMLQQTPVVRVAPVWKEWMERWPTPADMAAASQADVVRAWGRLGYPRRAMRLRECAIALVAEHGGDVPRETDQLRALPGIGEYTAAAVRVFAFGERDVVLDTNVRRVIGRAWHSRPLPPAHLTRPEREHAASLVPVGSRASALWNAGAMELGALVCTARAPRCGACVLAPSCAWVAAGAPGLDQAPRRTQAWQGTDRQVRGRVMALLRDADVPVAVGGHASLGDVEPGQLDRCLESLVADGLVTLVSADRGAYAL